MAGSTGKVRTTATRVRQGRWGRHMIWVLLVSVMLGGGGHGRRLDVAVGRLQCRAAQVRADPARGGSLSHHRGPGELTSLVRPPLSVRLG